LFLVTSASSNTAFVIDAGLAKVLGGGTGVTESLTEAGEVMGTFGYIAPEVFTGGPIDERADIFAIGVTLVETFVGAVRLAVRHRTRLSRRCCKMTFICPGSRLRFERSMPREVTTQISRIW
jgi:serine/threonine-protein kinase